MPTAKECKCDGYSYITYQDYCLCVDAVFKDQKVPKTKVAALKPILAFLSKFKKVLATHLHDLKIGMKDLIHALLSKDVYSVFSIIKFNFKRLIEALGAFQKMLNNDLLAVLNRLVNTDTFGLLKKKIIRVDDFLRSHPVLARISGLALCGMIIWMWMNMTFIGHLDFDFDLSHAYDALTGQYTFKHLLTTPTGLDFLFLFFTGKFALISVSYLMGAPYLLLFMIIYTGYKHPRIREDIKRYIKNKSTKINRTTLIPKLKL